VSLFPITTVRYKVRYKVRHKDPKNDAITVSICQASLPRTSNAGVLSSNVLIPAQIAPRYKNDETSLIDPAAT